MPFTGWTRFEKPCDGECSGALAAVAFRIPEQDVDVIYKCLSCAVKVITWMQHLESNYVGAEAKGLGFELTDFLESADDALEA